MSKTEFPHIILDNGKIVSASFGRELNTFHVQFTSRDADIIKEIFEKLSDVCNERWKTITCPDCKGEGHTVESSKMGTLCFTCGGVTVVPKPPYNTVMK